MDKDSQYRFDVIRRLAQGGTSGKASNEVFRSALAMAADLLGLAAAALVFWDDNRVVTMTVNHARSEQDNSRLQAMERDLFEDLRQRRNLTSAYMSFGGDAPYHSFTLPLQYGPRVFGAVVGLQEGDGNIVSEDLFLQTLSALVALTCAADSGGKAAGEDKRDALNRERHTAIRETAISVNHEVNNPLTAILGNVQLLLLKRDDLDEELVGKLRTIEQSAMKIKGVTQRLMNLTSANSVDYPGGESMIDLSDENDGQNDKTGNDQDEPDGDDQTQS